MRTKGWWMAIVVAAVASSAVLAHGVQASPVRSSTVAPPIPVCVSTTPSIPTRLIRPAMSEADAIWRDAGVRFGWRDVACDEAGSAASLKVEIADDVKSHVKYEMALGWIMFAAPETPLPHIVISRAAVEEMLDQDMQYRSDPQGLREVLIGRALGRALAHEIGHYLLRSSVHRPHGLMRATHSATQFVSLDRRDFALTHDDARIAARQAALIGRSASPSVPIAGEQPGTD